MADAISSLDTTQASANGQAGKAKASLAADFDAFLLLLTTQLKNQDPLSPMEPTEFTSQLVQFASVEQQINTNRSLGQLIASGMLYFGTTRATCFISAEIAIPLSPPSMSPIWVMTT